jgi:hypothetical protein
MLEASEKNSNSLFTLPLKEGRSCNVFVGDNTIFKNYFSVKLII